ncbi:MAG: ABC transporter permease [Methanoregulaceae archaeon]|nr:ABC transporter permease [Methanoregulaceae archaeon]
MRPAQIIFMKELREMFRDKRVRSGALVTPVFLVFSILLLFGFIIDTLARPENMKLSIIGSGPLVEQLKAAKVTVDVIPSVAEAEAKIRAGKARLVLEMPTEGAAPGKQVVVRAYFDDKDEKAQIQIAQTRAIFSKLSNELLLQTLETEGLPKEAAEPIKFEEKPIKVGSEQSASDFVIKLLPYIIVIYAFYGGMGSVGDLVAGEKEKKTLETLLITPVSRTDIAVGKFLALGTLCLASSLSAVVGLLLAGVIKLKIFEKLFPEGLGVSAMSLVLVVLVLLPAVVLFASLMLAISTRSKNLREAQTQLTLASLIVLMPAMFSQFIGLTDFANAMWVNTVPVLNTANAIRNVLLGKPELVPIAVGVVVNGVLGVIALAWAIRLFKQEAVLSST